MLKGAPFDDACEPDLRRPASAALSARGGAAPVAGRAPGAPWQVMQRVDHPDPAPANAEALHELENGADGLTLVPAGAIGAYGYGLAPGADALERALAGIHLDAGIAIDLEFARTPRACPRRSRHWSSGKDYRRPPSTSASASIRSARSRCTARSPRPGATCAALRSDRRRSCGARLQGPFASADGRVVHNAGGTEAQELAFALAAAVAYLRALEAGGIALDAARRMIYFRLAADADQFLTIAKFRALRKLWQRVEEGCGLAPAPAFIAAETAWRMMTRATLREHPARNDCGVFGRGRRRRRHHGAAVHRRARPARPLRAPRRAQHAARAAR